MARHGMRHGVRTALTGGTAVIALLATGCSGSDEDSKAKPAYDTKTKTQRIGAAGSTCALPVTFEIPADWKTAAAPSEAQHLLTVGLSEIVCELDARHGGTTGFVRVYLDRSRSSTPRFAVERFVTENKLAQRKNVEYRDTKVGPYEAVEVSYEGHNETWDARQKETHIGFRTPKGLLVLDVDAQDPIDHDALLPELDRIKDSLKGA
ncbi:lipoprotein [Streptomyces sp. NPDC006798]|uniref:lipoprotein n=1 Tax=Streptomyces sp. NPDC006798 TaxID=3155462 RepID=UPI00340F4E8E